MTCAFSWRLNLSIRSSVCVCVFPAARQHHARRALPPQTLVQDTSSCGAAASHAALGVAGVSQPLLLSATVAACRPAAACARAALAALDALARTCRSRAARALGLFFLRVAVCMCDGTVQLGVSMLHAHTEALR
jgi:hypothetical protein